MKGATSILIACLFFSAVFARHTKSHKARDSPIEGGEDGGSIGTGSPGGWPNPGSLGGFGVPEGLTQNLGDSTADSDDREGGEGRSAKRKATRYNN